MDKLTDVSVNSFWTNTPGLLERLLELRAQGVSLRRIASTLQEEFGRPFSRSSISGKLMRLGMVTSRQPSNKPPRSRRKKPVVEVVEETPVVVDEPPVVVELPMFVEPLVDDELFDEPEPVIVRPAPRPPLEGGLSLDFMEINSRTCKWPFGSLAPFTFCGCPVKEDGRPYCAAHSKTAYNKEPRRNVGVKSSWT